MKKTAYCIAIAFIICLSSAAGASALDGAIYRFPEIKPEYYAFIGARAASTEGSAYSYEYQARDVSYIAGGSLMAFPFPHRVYLEADYAFKDWYFIDAGYAYGSRLVFKDVSWGVTHNLENISLAPSAAYPVESTDSANTNYTASTSIHDLSLKVKPSSYPVHFFINGFLYGKNGDTQQRFLGGSAYWNGLTRASAKRSIKWNSNDITVGANTHLGPVEAELTHSIKKFQADTGQHMTYAYTEAVNEWAVPAETIRVAGNYPHNLIPELDGFKTELKLHTSYTGKVVASASASLSGRENLQSGAEANFISGAGSIMYSPGTRLTFALKYRHTDTEIDNPESLTDAYYGLSSTEVSISGIRKSISSVTDTITGSVRYRVFRPLTLIAGYGYKSIDRENAQEWDIKDKTTYSTASMSASLALPYRIKLKSKYEHRAYGSPAYNVEPDASDSIYSSVSCMPSRRLTLLLSHGLVMDGREGIEYGDTEDGGRDSKNSRYIVSASYMANKSVVISAFYTHLNYSTTQDIKFDYDTDIPAPVYKDIAYEDGADAVSLSVDYALSKKLRLGAGAVVVDSSGGFSPDPLALSQYSEIDQSETGFDAYADYMFFDGWDIALKYKYGSVDIKAQGAEDSTSQYLTLLLSKRI